MLDEYRELLQRGCFRWEHVCNLTGDKHSASNLIQHYLSRGYIERVRRNLYLVIPLDGRPKVSEYLIASNITLGSYISYHSAFSYYGLNNQMLFYVYVSSPTKFVSGNIKGMNFGK